MNKKAGSSIGLARQRSIYLGGMTGKKPDLPLDFTGLEAAAKERMRPASFGYIATGAGDGKAVKGNMDAWHQYSLVPRMLRNVEEADMTTNFCGTALSSPILLSPVGVLSLAHKEADLAVAKAAAASDVGMIFSNQASVEMERTAEAMDQTPYWFQLYWSRSRELVRSFAERAERSGCRGIIVTLDTTMLGWRPMDLQEAFLPFLHGKGLAQYLSDPVFREMARLPAPKDDQPKPRPTLTGVRNALRLMATFPGGFFQNIRTGFPLSAVRLFIRTYTNPALNWQDLTYLREVTQLPIILKGILHPDDAMKAVDSGMDAIIVSNHGGRQVEASVATAHQLPLIRKAVGDQFPVAVDSGIRTGGDIMKAIRLGADAVGIGRPFAYALALGGQEGVREYLENLKADLDLNMRLSGCRSIEDVRQLDLKTNYGS